MAWMVYDANEGKPYQQGLSKVQAEEIAKNKSFGFDAMDEAEFEKMVVLR